MRIRITADCRYRGQTLLTGLITDLPGCDAAQMMDLGYAELPHDHPYPGYPDNTESPNWPEDSGPVDDFQDE